MDKTFYLPYLGKIDLEQQSRYNTSIDLDNKTIEVDVSFECDEVDDHKIIQIEKFLDRLSAYGLQNLEYIRLDFEKQHGTAWEYTEYHVSEFGKEMFSSFSLDDKKSGIPKFNLKRVGIYPADESFAVFDYTFLDFDTDYLLVVKTDEKGELIRIVMES